VPITPGRWVAETSTYRPDRYYRYAELTELLHRWAAEHPHLLTIESIGTTGEGRDIWALTLTDRSTGEPGDKPAYFVDANIHADEVTGVATVLWLLDHVLTRVGTDAALDRLLAATTLYLIPALNVDGMDVSLAGGHPFVRSSLRPFPTPVQRDGLVERDIDGDGTILTMRVRDPAGPWKVSALDPRVMTRRGADEAEGAFYFVLPEGDIQGWDGANVPIAPALYGIDANRNFPADWAPHWVQQGAGDYPLSEPEPRALADFLLAHPTIHGAQHFHTWSGCILRPPTAHPTADLPDLDRAILTDLGAIGTEETGYPCIGIHDDFAYDRKRPMRGGQLDWDYQQVGIVPFTTELWSLVARAGVEVTHFIEFFKDRSDTVDAAMLGVLDRELDGEGFREWTPFQHPQLGPVEIGGWDRAFTWTNPPGPMLEEVTSANARFVLRAAATAPMLAIREATAEQLAEGLYRLRVVAENTGYLPSYVTEQARSTGVSRPVTATLGLADGGRFEVGEAEVELGHLDGRANLSGQLLWNDVFPIANRGRAEWVVRQPAGTSVTVTVSGNRAGTVRAEVALT
jgi:murein tripeptide amidase MpaA